MNRLILLIAPLVFIAALVIYYTFSPSQVDKKRMQELMNKVSATVETQNREKIVGLMGDSLTGDAKISLKIRFPMLPGEKNPEVTTEDFNKAEFLHFIDTMLTTVTDYHFTGSVGGVRLDSEGAVGMVDFKGRVMAAGTQMDNNQHFTSDMACKAVTRFNQEAPDAPPQVAELGCVMKLYFPPKPNPKP